MMITGLFVDSFQYLLIKNEELEVPWGKIESFMNACQSILAYQKQ
jgi:hypothetical protein